MIFVYEDRQVNIPAFQTEINRPNLDRDEFTIKIDRSIPPEIADQLILGGVPKAIVKNTDSILWFPFTRENIKDEYWNLEVPESGDIIINYGPQVIT